MRIIRVVEIALAVGVGFVSSAFGAVCQAPNCSTTEFGIQSAGAGELAGVYTDPYVGYVGGTPGNGGVMVGAFCDDFVNEVNPPQYWSSFDTKLDAMNNGTTVSSVYYSGGQSYSNLAGITSTTTYTQTQEYMAVAFLAMESINAGAIHDLHDQELYSFALWDIFDPSVLNTDCPLGPSYCLDSTGQSNLDQIRTDAAAALQFATGGTAGSLNGSDFESHFNLNVNIYSADATDINNNLVVSTAGNRPQEFVTVTPGSAQGAPVPELSSFASMLIDGVCGGAIALFFWRRRSSSRSAA